MFSFILFIVVWLVAVTLTYILIGRTKAINTIMTVIGIYQFPITMLCITILCITMCIVIQKLHKVVVQKVLQTTKVKQIVKQITHNERS